MEPTTMMGGTQTDFPDPVAKRETSGKKKKPTKAEKAAAKLSKAAQAIKTSPDTFHKFVDKLDHWLRLNHKRAIKLFTEFDITGEGVVTFDEFKAVMLDLGAPCSAVELHLLAMLLDRRKVEEIAFAELAKGLSIVREREANHSANDLRPALIRTDEKYPKCPHCLITRWDGENFKEKYLRYITIEFWLLKFEGFRKHPGHTVITVHSHMSVHSLLQLLQDKTKLYSSNLAIFKDKSYETSAMLSPDKTLEESGYMGGPQNKPEKITLFYDYKAEFTDCPLLMCDHYFGKKFSMV